MKSKKRAHSVPTCEICRWPQTGNGDMRWCDYHEKYVSSGFRCDNIITDTKSILMKAEDK